MNDGTETKSGTMTFDEAMAHSKDLELACWKALAMKDRPRAEAALRAHIAFNPYRYWSPQSEMERSSRCSLSEVFAE